MIDVVLAIDPPRAWALWGLQGPIYAEQFRDATDAARDEVIKAIDLALETLPVRVRGAIVEEPFVGLRDDVPMMSIVHNAVATGYLERYCIGKLWPTTRMTANVWRAILCFPGGLLRDDLKLHGHRLACKAANETQAGPLVALHGPKHGKMLDASDAVCQSMAGWITLFGRTGALACWKETGSFKV